MPEFPNTFALTVAHAAIPQPRHNSRIGKSSTGKQFVQLYIPQEHPVHLWKAQVVDAWRAVMPTPGFRLQGPIVVLQRFIMPRPGELIWKTKPMPRQMSEKIAAGQNSGDVDNLAKAVYDALTGRCWQNDFEIAWSWQERWIAAGDEDPHLELFMGEIDLNASSLWDALVAAAARACSPMPGPATIGE